MASNNNKKQKDLESQNKVLKEQSEQQADQIKNLSAQLVLLENAKKKQDELNKLSADYSDILQARIRRQRESNDEADKRTAIEQEYHDVSEEIQKVLEKQEKVRDIILTNSGKQFNLTDKQLDQLKDELEFVEQTYKNRQKILAFQKDPENYAAIQKVKDLQEKYNKELAKTEDAAKKLAAPFTSAVGSIKTGLSKLGPVGDLISMKLEGVFEAAEKGSVASAQKSITGKLFGTKSELDAASKNLQSKLDAANVDAKSLGVEFDDASKKAIDTANASGNIGERLSEASGTGSGALSKMKGGFKGLLTAGSSAFSGLMAGARAFMTVLMTNPIFLIIAGVVALGAALFSVIKRANHLHEEMVGITREQGLTKEAALEYMSTLNKAETDMSALGLKLSAFNEQAKAGQKAFSDLFQTSLSLSKKNIQLATVLQVQYGATADEAIRFQEAVALNGESIAGNINLLENTVGVINKQTNMGLRQADVVKAIAGSSKSILANYKNSIPALTQAFAIAKQYGMTLKDAEESSSKLLNIDESIQAEMEARVLTGKDLNLNEARLLALQGKSSEAIKSMVDQIGSYEEIQDMLPMQQEALAKAMGMSRDQLITSVKQQSIMANLSEQTVKGLETLTTTQIESMKAAQLGLSETQKEQLIASRMQQTAAEMQEGAMAKGAAFFDAVAKKGLKGLFFGGGMEEEYKAAGTKTAEQSELDRASGSGTMANDFISRPGMPLQMFNKDDIIIGATNPFGAGTSDGESSTAQLLKEQNELLKQLISSVKQPTVIKMGSRTIEELDSQISLRKNINLAADSSYGTRI